MNENLVNQSNKLVKKEVINGKNPREFKVKFAQEIVERYHGKDASLKAHLDFEDRFKNKLIPERVRLIT